MLTNNETRTLESLVCLVSGTCFILWTLGMIVLTVGILAVQGINVTSVLMSLATVVATLFSGGLVRSLCR